MNADVDGIWATATAELTAAWEVRLGRQVLTTRDRDRLFPGAGMVTTLIAALIDEDVAAGSFQLSRPVPVTRASVAGDDGLLRFGQIPTMHRLGDLMLAMVAVADNTATNTLIGFLGGPDAISLRCAAHGWESRLHDVVGDSAAEFSSVSVSDHQAALAQITHPLIVKAFSAQQDRRALGRCVDVYADFRHKTGTVNGARHDAGVLVTDRGPLWVACFTDGGPVTEWVDHPACVAMGLVMQETLLALDLANLSAS